MSAWPEASMASLSADRPSEVVLAARVARQFYLEGVSKVDIAGRLGISRFRVARRRARCRAVGGTLLGLRPAARVRLQLPRGRITAAPASRRGRRPGADGP